ncbi:VOC family protein [Streptomyces sp. MMCC 100]|uniref:VOC family protein n=1 Tax=Streptomyces sp. MMCC 100 TaxID=3163555 RepID=UPI003594C804
MTSTSVGPGSNDIEAPRVPAIYHPTLGVHDLEAARSWFSRVFELPTLRWEDTLDLAQLEPDYPVNYSFFMFIKDFHFVVLCPELHARGALAGQSRYRGVPDGMIGIGWYTDDAVAMFDRLARFGFPAHDQRGRTIGADNPPVSSIAKDILVGFTFPEQAGMRHEFEELGHRHHEFYSRRADPRLRPGWTRPGVATDDPLRIVRSSHHTIVTTDLARALRLYVDASGGTVLAERLNRELAATSTFVALGDSVVEFAVPDPGSPLLATVADGQDHYTEISLQVADLDTVDTHLRSVGLTPQRLGDDVVTIEPGEAFGVRWRFIAELPYQA